MKTLTSLLFLILPLMVCSQSISRDVVAAGGDFQTTSNLSLSSTVGEPVIKTVSQSNIVLTQGFQQGNLTNSVGIDVPEHNLSINAYPNPTQNQVVLEMSATQDQGLSLMIFDVQGKLLKAPIERQELKGQNRFTVDLGNYTAGTYLFRLMNADGKRLHTIKVQKVY